MHITRLSEEDVCKLSLDPERIWMAGWNPDLRTARMVDDVCGTRTLSHVVGAWYNGELLSDFQITTERFTPREIWEPMRRGVGYHPCRTETRQVNGEEVVIKYNEPT